MTMLDHLPSLHRAATPRIDPAIWPSTARVDELGRLCIGDVALTDIADEFRTPAYILDETHFRHRIRDRRAALPGVEMVYAAESLLTTDVARCVAEEGVGIGVGSSGELAVALAAGVDPARIVLHGSAASVDELRSATAVGVGRIVIDSLMEVAYLACEARRRQRVLIRVTPDIGLHHWVAESAERILSQPLLELVGLCCHIGSQITDPAGYGEAIHRMVAAMADVRAAHGIILTELDIGGEHAVPPPVYALEPDLGELAAVIDDALDQACAAERFPRPRVVVDQGCAISARAVVALYRVVSVRSQSRGRTFVGVDGGMSDNPQIALCGTKYTVVLANRHELGPMRLVTVTGRHPDDELARDVELPADVRPGDLLAVACTGAYQHSMASNYSMTCRPPVIAVRHGRIRELIRRETTADLLARDLGWSGRTAV